MNNSHDDIPAAAKALRDQVLGLRREMARLRAAYLGVFLAAASILTASVTGVLLVFYPHADAIFPLAVTLPLLLSLAVLRAMDVLYRGKSRAMLIEALSITSGFTFASDGAAGDMAAHAICPQADKIAPGDTFSGSYNDVPLTLLDLTLGGKKNTMTCLCARLRLRRPVDGHIIVVTANAAKTYFKDRYANYGKVGVANPKYDRQLEIFATERSEGRLVADAAFLERLMEAGGAMKARWVATSFLKNDVLFMIDAARPLLYLPPLWSPVVPEDLMRVYWQFEAFFKIIDALRANRLIQAA